MKKITYLMSFAVIAALMLSSCAKGDNPSTDPVEPTQKKALYTIIFYGTIGDVSDPIAESMWKFAQEQLKNRDDIRFTVCWKYAKPEHFKGKYAKPGDIVKFELTDTTNLTKIGENYAVYNPTQTLYDEQFLTDFINYAAEKCPAENYILFLFGHGTGFDAATDYEKDQRKTNTAATRRGLLYDEWFTAKGGVNPGDALNMYELLRGIYNSKVQQFNLIYFYDCLMGNLESLFDIHALTDYMVVSEHAMAMSNIPYEQFLKSLVQLGDIETICRRSLENIPKEWDSEYSMILANGDLKLLKSTEMQSLLEPARKLSTRLQELYPTMQEKLDTAVVRTYQLINRHNLFDFADYAHKVAELTDDAELKQIATEVDAAFDKMIICRRESHTGHYGDLPRFTLSCVLCNQAAYEKDTEQGYTFQTAYEYTNWHIFTDWGNWLKTNQQVPKDQTRKFLGQPVGLCL